jgi:hypothetical protein
MMIEEMGIGGMIEVPHRRGMGIGIGEMMDQDQVWVGEMKVWVDEMRVWEVEIEKVNGVIGEVHREMIDVEVEVEDQDKDQEVQVRDIGTEVRQEVTMALVVDKEDIKEVDHLWITTVEGEMVGEMANR